jgi:hypothetical protein
MMHGDDFMNCWRNERQIRIAFTSFVTPALRLPARQALRMNFSQRLKAGIQMCDRTYQAERCGNGSRPAPG